MKKKYRTKAIKKRGSVWISRKRYKRRCYNFKIKNVN